MKRILDTLYKEENYNKEKAFEIIIDIGDTRAKYQKLRNQRTITKPKMLEIIEPFRDRYHLSDTKALSIIKDNMTIKKAYKLAIELAKEDK